MWQIKMAKHGDSIRSSMQAELQLANSGKLAAADRNKALLDSLQASFPSSTPLYAPL